MKARVEEKTETFKPFSLIIDFEVKEDLDFFLRGMDNIENEYCGYTESSMGGMVRQLFLQLQDTLKFKIK